MDAPLVTRKHSDNVGGKNNMDRLSVQRKKHHSNNLMQNITELSHGSDAAKKDEKHSDRNSEDFSFRNQKSRGDTDIRSKERKHIARDDSQAKKENQKALE